MTPKELGELVHLKRAVPHVDSADLPDEGAAALLEPGVRQSVALLRDFAAPTDDKHIAIDFDFFAMLVAIEVDGKVDRIIVERTEMDDQLRSRGTGERYSIDCSLVVSCIGYRSEAHTYELQSLMR